MPEEKVDEKPLLPPEEPLYDPDSTPQLRHASHRQLLLIFVFACIVCLSDVLERHVPIRDLVLPPNDPYMWIDAHVSNAFDREQAFLRVPDAESIRQASRNYTASVHIAGSPADRESALVIKEQWGAHLGLPTSKTSQNVFDAGSRHSKRFLTAKGRGDRVWTDSYYTVSIHLEHRGAMIDLTQLLNYPTNESYVRLVRADGTSMFNASLHEPGLDEDWTSKTDSNYTPPFHGFSKGGFAKGQLIYANRGRFEDFEELARRGITVTGKIVLVRYGGSFRGLKVSLAEKAGAAAVLIYSDPFDDGEFTPANGYAAYPHGPARHPDSVQRGSVNTLSKYPGDPLTPGKPSYKEAKRLSRDDERLSVPRIPSIPISYNDALPLLRDLERKGQRIGGEWEGALEGIQYWTGPTTNEVHFFNGVEDSIKPIWNTYALLEGHVKDEVVMLGIHRDAWVFGATDPSSGTACMHDIVKAFGALRRSGWKPFRTILIASWDGEEYGLIGSTEFGEDYPKWIKEHVVAYLNLDSAVAGTKASTDASPSLAPMLLQALKDVGRLPGDRESNDTLKDVGDLGSGSDYTVFLQHLGIPSSYIKFDRKKTDPVYHYHSIYDSEYWQEDFGDPSFEYHLHLSKWQGLAALRLADSPLLHLNISHYSNILSNYSDKVRSALKASSLDEDKLDLTPLDDAVERVQHASHDLTMMMVASRQTACSRRRARTVKKANKAMRQFEKGFISKGGLPVRPWYKHLGIAPGRWLGYGATSFPGLTEAITIDRDLDSAKHEMNRIIRRLEVIAKSLRAAVR